MVKYLFILPTPRAGATILLKSLNNSPNISTFIGEGVKQYVFPEHSGEYLIMNKEYRKNKYKYNFSNILEWLKISLDGYWDQDKKVHCDQSYIYTLYAKSIENYFSKFGEVFFILMIRNPTTSRPLMDCDWDKFALKQKYNKENLKNVCFFSYEEFVENPESIRSKILKFLPDLEDFNMNKDITKKFKNIITNQTYITSEISKYFGYSEKLTIKKKILTDNKKKIIKNKRSKYLFILCPPFSGSTILHKIINSSNNVSSFLNEEDSIEGQGQGFLNMFINDYEKNRHNTSYTLPVDKVKDIYDKYWDLSKSILCHRSPPFIHFSKQLEEYFSKFGDVYFICMIRNPYACRWVKEFNWLQFAKEQKYNIENLKNVCFFTYKELVEFPNNIKKKISKLLPELENIDMGINHMKLLNEYDKRSKKINCSFKDRILDKFNKNKILKNEEEIINSFGYKHLN
jgi:hypothetical protein